MVSIAYFIACQLLAIGGSLKLLSPQLSHDAWKKLNFPSSLTFVRSIGFLEFTTAICGMIFAGKFFPFVVAAWFAIFSVLTWHILRLPVALPCGCFGKSEVPTSRSHLLMNFALMIVSLGSVGVDGLGEQVSSRNWWGLGYIAILILGSILAYAVVTYDFAFRIRSRNSQLDR
ncbi:MAG: hypothetical protein CL501_02945 [Actinobacteria bacterium]|nr:hypothetical protein [Actinomycetota bacterium]MBD30281.1 hypothetical protein [Acidimicrobiaceae bacterium]|tara:strand:+ start:27 stop:545 length:519 start_codon:yes stop_codon:yes gene_type:complete